MKNNLAPRSSPQLPEAIVAGIALWLLVIPVLTAQEESFEKVGEPYTMQAKPSQPGQSVGEVMLDEGGIEILWRVHYRFFEPVKAGQDTDRDGIDDVAEATAWTDPRTADKEQASASSAYGRRQSAIDASKVQPVQIDGKPATPADLLNVDEESSRSFAVELAMTSKQATERAEAYAKQTGNALFKSGTDRPASQMVDVRQGIPTVLAGFSTATNNFVNVSPLWPGGAITSNVTGSAKFSGLWELTAPRTTHQELIGRIMLKDDIADPRYFSATEPHSTQTAGIMGAAGVVVSLKGAAYETGIWAYRANDTLTDINGLTTPGFKNMRASNHSYGPITGWGTAFFTGSSNPYARWYGDLNISTAGTGWESHLFGLYDVSAKDTDTTTNNKPYHLMVAAAGNDRTNSIGTSGYVFQLYQAPAPTYIGPFYLTTKGGVAGFYNGVSFWPSTTANPIPLDPNLGIALAPANISPTSFVATPPADGGATGFDTLPSGMQEAKNVLCIGALKDINTVASYSSWGPTDDGRIKPDLVALGGDTGALVTSTSAATDLAMKDDAGTSVAAPAVTGAITLLSQYQENLRGNKEPYRASTFRALAIHTATDFGVTGPDYKTGWGIFKADAAADIIKTNANRGKIAEVFIPNGSTATYPLKAIGGQPVKITIAWSDKPGVVQPDQVDPPGTAAGLKILTNDLNLRLARISPATTLFPWKPDPANPGASSIGTGDNDRDNVEQIILNNPVANEDLTLTIAQKVGTTLVGGNQWVSVIITGAATPHAPAYETDISSAVYNIGGGSMTATITFGTVLGGYYKIQYVPYGQPPNTWFDATGTYYALSDSISTYFSVTSQDQRPIRVVAISPNPFNI